MSVYYAESYHKSGGGGWALGEDARSALRDARRNIGVTVKEERASYVLEFPDGAEPQCASEVWGGWRAKLAPTRVAFRRGFPPTVSDAQLMGAEK